MKNKLIYLITLIVLVIFASSCEKYHKKVNFGLYTEDGHVILPVNADVTVSDQLILQKKKWEVVGMWFHSTEHKGKLLLTADNYYIEIRTVPDEYKYLLNEHKLNTTISNTEMLKLRTLSDAIDAERGEHK